MNWTPPIAAQDSMTWMIFALGALTVIYVAIRPMLRKKKDPLEKLPSLSVSQQRAVEREMQNLLVEMSEMARQISAQLDTRSAKLEALMDEADRKIAELRRLGDGVKAAVVEPAGPEEPRVEDGRYARIYAMADEGRAVGEIAREAGMPQGEVELILALRAK